VSMTGGVEARGSEVVHIMMALKGTSFNDICRNAASMVVPRDNSSAAVLTPVAGACFEN
jgi:hypothetical protein